MRYLSAATAFAFVISATLLAGAVQGLATRDNPPAAQAHLVFMGDLMLGRYVGASLEKTGYDSAFANVKTFLSSADIAVGNLEGPLVPADRFSLPSPSVNQPLLTGNAAAAPALGRAGFDLLSVANNHSMDEGEAGLEATANVIESSGMQPLGLEKNRQVDVVVRNVRGLRIAFLACTLIAPNQPAQPGAATLPFYVDPASEQDKARLAGEVKQARQQADVVVVVTHWGTEYASRPDDTQKQIASLLSDAGADLVVGAHPHVAQGMELLGGNGRPSLVAYSLGNALFDQNTRPETTGGLALEATVDREGVVSARLVPLKINSAGGSYAMALDDNESGQQTLQRAALSTPALLQRQALWDAASKPGIALAYRRTPEPTSSQEDLGMDGLSQVWLENGTLTVSGSAGGKPVEWKTGPDWRVTGYTVGDADGDGRPELIYTLWKPRLTSTRPESGGLSVNMEGGEVLPHIYINGWRKGGMAPVWQGSPRPAPVLSVAVASVGAGGKPLLASLDSNDLHDQRVGTVHLWQWAGGFGYELVTALPGAYSELWSDGRILLFR